MFANLLFVSFLSFGFRKSCKKQSVHGQWITRICKRLWTMLAKWKGNPVLIGHCSIICHWQLSELRWWDIIPKQYYRVYLYIITSHLCMRIFETTILQICCTLRKWSNRTYRVHDGWCQTRFLSKLADRSHMFVMFHCWCTTQRCHNFPKSWKK